MHRRVGRIARGPGASSATASSSGKEAPRRRSTIIDVNARARRATPATHLVWAASPSGFLPQAAASTVPVS